MSEKVLFVDDERSILSSLRRLFKNSSFELLTAGSGQEALDIIQNIDDLAVILSDQKMPGIDGLTVLKKCGEKHPETIRIALTGDCETENIIACMNEAHVSHFVTKPWKGEYIKSVVNNAVKSYTSTKVKAELISLITEQNVKLEQINKYKTEFLANMSHELRTPLNAILILSGDLMKNSEKNLTEDQKKSAEIINASGTELLTLINEILDLSKIESGKMSVEIIEFRVTDFIENIKNTYMKMAEKKGLEFITEIDENVPETIKTDSHKLGQILKNFISNAFKFTSKGSVKIKVSFFNKDQELITKNIGGQGLIQISVVDTGIGIAREQQKMIFEAFQQADGSTTRKFGGTGLGLTISKEFAEILGGEIVLNSEVGKGTEFILKIPNLMPSRTTFIKAEKKELEIQQKTLVNTSSLIDESRDNVTKSNSFLQNKCIMVVDDDMRNLFAISRILVDKGIEVLKAETGMKALEILKHNQKINLILMDIMMTEMDGYEAMKIIRNDKSNYIRNKNIPIIAMTAKAMKEDRKKCIDAGASDYITKPVDVQKLFSLLNVWLH